MLRKAVLTPRCVQERTLLAAFLLHCADLTNVVAPPPLSARRASLLSLEFEAQADAERAAGLPVTVLLAPDDLAKARMETSFILYVCRPLFEQLVAISPPLAFLLDAMDANVAAWAAVIEAGQQPAEASGDGSACSTRA